VASLVHDSRLPGQIGGLKLTLISQSYKSKKTTTINLLFRMILQRVNSSETKYKKYETKTGINQRGKSVVLYV